MREFDYQRTVIAYHGCEESLVHDVLISGKEVDSSENGYDWLGRGIYFWEHGPRRALEWAKGNKKVKKPAVLGAVMHLGNCFDLLDTRSTEELLAKLFPKFRLAYEREHPYSNFPENDFNRRKHYLDCAVIDWAIDFLEKEDGLHFHSVRGAFLEGGPAFEGSAINLKSHIQIAIRDPKVIIGYFKPELDMTSIKD